MKEVCVILSCLIGMFPCETAAARTQDVELQTVRVVSFGRQLPVMIGQMHGLFAKYGVQVVPVSVTSSAELRSLLAEGRADIAHAAVDNAVAMAESGGTDVIIVSGGDGSVNELIAQPGIQSIADLRGRTVIVDATDTAYALQLKKILLLNGLQQGRDYQVKRVGVTSMRLAAMREHKDYAAAMLGPPVSILAKHSGFVSLGSTRVILGPYQDFGAFVRHRWARKHADLLERYLAGYVEAQRWLLASVNKQEVLELLKKESGLSPDLAEEDYLLRIVSSSGYQKDAQLDQVGFKNVLSLRAEIEGTWHGRPPALEKYYDPSYYENAMRRLKSKIAMEKEE